MRKICFLLLIVLFISPISAEGAEFFYSQEDMDSFFSLADGYISMAQEFVSGEDLGFDDYFYSDSDALFDASEEYLEDFGWTYLEMNDFLYIIRITLDFICLVDTYGDVLGEEIGGLREDISDEMLEMVRNNFDQLTQYFNLVDYSEM